MARRQVATNIDAFQNIKFSKAMLLKITSKRQVTFPRHVMERLRLKEGDTFSISETAEGILIKPHRFKIEELAPLKQKVNQNLPLPNLDDVRHSALDSNLRD